MTETTNAAAPANETADAATPVVEPAATTTSSPITCASCLHFKASTPGFGVCKRYPPEPIKVGPQGRVANQIHDTDWCGEHPDIQELVRA